MDELKDAVKRKMSFAQTMRAVLWSFIGLRKGAAHESDMAKLNPVHVVIAGGHRGRGVYRDPHYDRTRRGQFGRGVAGQEVG